MNKALIIIAISLLSCLFLKCKNVVTDASNIVKTKTVDSTLVKIAFPKQGLVAFYSFNGNADDSSGNGNNGFNEGAILTADRFGDSSSAYLFSNCSSIRIPELLSDSCPAFTFTAWVKQNEKTNAPIIFHGTIKGEASLGISDGKISFGVNLHVPGTLDLKQNWYTASTVDTLKVNTYYFIVGRYIKGQKLDLMVNGDLVASTAVPNLNLLTNPDRSYSAIGKHTQSGYFSQSYCWNGIIDDICIYSRSLTDQEVLVLYYAGGWTLDF